MCAHACVHTLCLVAHLCLTLFYPMDCSPLGCSVHGDSPGKNTGMGSHALLQGNFPTQGPNPSLLRLMHCRQILYCWITGGARHMLGSFNGQEPGGPESTDKKIKERKRGWYLLVYAGSQQSPCTGLALFTKASGALSMGWRRRALSQEGLWSPGSKVNTENLCAPKK